jgi:hypothetical protein
MITIGYFKPTIIADWHRANHTVRKGSHEICRHITSQHECSKSELTGPVSAVRSIFRGNIERGKPFARARLKSSPARCGANAQPDPQTAAESSARGTTIVPVAQKQLIVSDRRTAGQISGRRFSKRIEHAGKGHSQTSEFVCIRRLGGGQRGKRSEWLFLASTVPCYIANHSGGPPSGPPWLPVARGAMLRTASSRSLR